MQCKSCDGQLRPDGTCPDCEREQKFADFARANGLNKYPDPNGERYLYRSDDGGYACKKSEKAEFIDDLWNALVLARGGDKDLLVNQE